MAVTNGFKAKLRSKEHPIQAGISSPSILYTELVASAGYDSVMIDLQHGAIDVSQLQGMLATFGSSDATPIVRVPWNEPSWIQRVLDAGAHGVICPMVNSREECERFVSYCKVPPLGKRSPGSFRLDMSGTYDMNELVMAIVQIETPQALESIDQILGVPGVDGVFPGLHDYALAAFGRALEFMNPQLLEPLQRIVRVAHSHELPVGLPVPVEMTRVIPDLLRIGIDWVMIGSDIAWVTKGAHQTLSETRQAIAEGLRVGPVSDQGEH